MYFRNRTVPNREESSPRSRRSYIYAVEERNSASQSPITITDNNPKMIGLHGDHINLFIEPGPPLGPVLEVTVDDVDEAKRRLVKSGCEIVKDEPDFSANLRQGSVRTDLQPDAIGRRSRAVQDRERPFLTQLRNDLATALTRRTPFASRQ
jgi:hypothetical protein